MCRKNAIIKNLLAARQFSNKVTADTVSHNFGSTPVYIIKTKGVIKLSELGYGIEPKGVRKKVLITKYFQD
jgi:hypothetical protein